MNLEDVANSARLGLRERLLAGGGLSIERLPLLRTVFEDMASRLEEAFRGVCDPSAKFLVAEIAAGRTNDILQSLECCASTAAFVGLEQESKLLTGIDRKFVFALLEALFGADGSEAPFEDDRELSKVEIRVARFAFGRSIEALEASFASVANISFDTTRTPIGADIAVDGRKNAWTMMCRCRLSAFGREGEMVLAIPQTVLDPFREALSREPFVGAPLLDSDWAKRMENRVTQTEVSVHAVMEKPGLTLADIARLEVGQIVELPISPTSLIKLECEGQALFWCELGQKDGVYTIRIEDLVDQDQEFIDDVLGG